MPTRQSLIRQTEGGGNMKKIYVSPELSLSEASDVVATSAYVETEKIGFPTAANASGENSTISSVGNLDLFEI